MSVRLSIGVDTILLNYSTPDESLVMLSTTIQLFLNDQSADDSSRPSNSLRNHVQRLMVRLGGVYLRAMLSKLVGESWLDILISESTMPLRERLAVALFFLPDDEVLARQSLSLPLLNVSAHSLAIQVPPLTR